MATYGLMPRNYDLDDDDAQRPIPIDPDTMHGGMERESSSAWDGQYRKPTPLPILPDERSRDAIDIPPPSVGGGHDSVARAIRVAQNTGESSIETALGPSPKPNEIVAYIEGHARSPEEIEGILAEIASKYPTDFYLQGVERLAKHYGVRAPWEKRGRADGGAVPRALRIAQRKR